MVVLVSTAMLVMPVLLMMMVVVVVVVGDVGNEWMLAMIVWESRSGGMSDGQFSICLESSKILD